MAFMSAIVAIVMYSIDLYKHGRKKHLIGWASSAGFVLLTLTITLKLIFDHFTHWNQPKIQKYVVRIIWMVPLYSIESWMALRFKAWALHFETIRECYEAYVIFSFLYYLIALLGEEAQLISILKEKPEDLGHHQFPVNLCMSPWIMGHELLHKCKVGVLQYVVIKNLLAVTIFILASLNLYEEGAFRLDKGYVYIAAITNISQLWALYSLILFYIVTKEELSPWRPLGKFLCVKGVVFFTFFQSILINVAASLTRNIRELQGSDDSKDNWTESEVAKGLQDYLICIEMFIFAIAFNFAFTHKDYIGIRFKELHTEKEEEKKPFFLSAFLQSSVPDDMFSDIRRYPTPLLTIFISSYY